VAVTCEVAPHHFVLTDEAVRTLDPNFKMNPPLRARADVDAVLEGLADGTIDIIASDHAPHSESEKQAGFIKAPFGIIGLETMLPLAITFLVERKILTLAEVIAKMTVHPARLLGLKSEIRVGETANLTLFNPAEAWQIDKNQFKSNARNTPFHGWHVQGKVFGVFNQGKYWQQPNNY
jgi:dihydroorotase